MASSGAHVPPPARTQGRGWLWALLAGAFVMVLVMAVVAYGVAYYAGAFGVRGRFADKPHVCSLLRADLVSAIVPNPKVEEVLQGDCRVVEDDNAGPSDSGYSAPDELSVSQHHFTTRAGDNPEITSEFFDQTYARGATRLTGIGDEACVSAISFAVRVSNLIVVFSPMGGLIAKPDNMDKIRPLAEHVARELQSR